MDSAETKEVEALSLTSPRINLLIGALLANKDWFTAVANAASTADIVTLATAGLRLEYTSEECRFVVAHLVTMGYVRIS